MITLCIWQAFGPITLDMGVLLYLGLSVFDFFIKSNKNSSYDFLKAVLPTRNWSSFLLSELQDTLLHRMRSAYTCLFKSRLSTKIMCLAKFATREPASHPTLFQWLSWVFCVATWCSYDLVSDLLYVRME